MTQLKLFGGEVKEIIKNVPTQARTIIVQKSKKETKPRVKNLETMSINDVN